jgi:hypothetical protein
LIHTSFYLKANSVYDKSIAEYMMILDCRLNSGSTGVATSISDNKVCQANTSVTGPNSGGRTWVQANNLILDAMDTGAFKVNTELDISNNGADCAVGPGGRNCYHLYLSGNVGNNPVTAFMVVAATGGNSTSMTKANAHFGILINGASGLVSDNVDIDNSGRAPVGICQGCLLPGSTHSIAAYLDNSVSPYGIALNGTYSTTAISAQLPTTTTGGGPQYVCTSATGNFYRNATCGVGTSSGSLVGDGTTDNTTAFQALLTAAGTNGTSVNFPCGDFVITGATTLNVAAPSKQVTV